MTTNRGKSHRYGISAEKLLGKTEWIFIFMKMAIKYLYTVVSTVQ